MYYLHFFPKLLTLSPIAYSQKIPARCVAGMI